MLKSLGGGFPPPKNVTKEGLCMKKISAKVKKYNGIPAIYLNGSPVTGNMFFLNGDTLDFSQEIYQHELMLTNKCGFHAYTTNINIEYGEPLGLSQRHKKIFDTIIDADPDAVIMVRVNFTCFTLEDRDDVIVLDGKRQNLVSIASERWAEETELHTRKITEQIRADERYSAHIIGYHLEWLEWMQPQFYLFVDTCNANTERFSKYIKNIYSTEQELQAQWGKEYNFENISIPSDIPMDDAAHSMLIKEGDRRFRDYLDYMGELTADRIERFAKAIKEESDNESIVISFYGYFFEIYHASAGHFALRKLLNSPYIDGFASPDTYIDRNAGKDARTSCGGYMTVAESVIRSGKIWISESDQRTFINRLPHEQDVTSYPPLPDIEAIKQIHRRAVGMAMVHGTSLYPMELTGCGWYDDIEIWKNFYALDTAAKHYRDIFDMPRFETALVVDERANAKTGCSRMSAQSLPSMLHNFYRTGTRFALLELQDVLEGKADDISFFVFADPFCITDDEAEKLHGILSRNGKTAVFLNNFGLTSKQAAQRLTGMSFEVREGCFDRSLKAENGYFDEESFEMELRVIPSGVSEVLGRYSDGEVGFASRTENGYTAIFCATPSISVQNLQKLMQNSGVQLLSDGKDIVTANDRMIMHLSVSLGEKCIRFNEPTDIYDDLSGKFMEKIREYIFNADIIGEVRWIFTGESAQAWCRYRQEK